MPTPKNPADYRDMDEPLNVEGDPDEVLAAILAITPDDDADPTK